MSEPDFDGGLEMWWAYLHKNGTVQLKPWFGDVRDYTDDCHNNPFVKRVMKPFAAATRERAFEMATNYLKGTTT